MKLVHHHPFEIRVAALTQGHVGQDLRRAADHRRVTVDAGVARHHPDVLGAEDLAEGEELLADQGLDGCRVEGAAAPREGREARGEGLIVPVADQKALCAALRTLCTNPQRLHSMGRAARARIEREFAFDRMVAAYHAIIAGQPEDNRGDMRP